MVMTVSIRISGDLKKITKHATELERRHIPAATVRGINRTLSWIRTRAKREGATLLRVPVGTVNKRMKMHKASRRNPSAILRFLVGGINAARITPAGPRQTAAGVRSGKHSFPGAFAAHGIGDQLAVFRRQGPHPYPLKGMKIDTGPAVARLTQIVTRESRARFALEFQKDLRGRLRRGSR